jgi:hypothetical protein
MPPPFVVNRTVDIATNLSAELRVSLTTALLWAPEYERKPDLLRASADGRANREGRELLRERRISTGRWRVTWTGMTVVVELLEPPAG